MSSTATYKSCLHMTVDCTAVAQIVLIKIGVKMGLGLASVLVVLNLFLLALVSACPSLVVYREDLVTELNDSTLLHNNTITLKVGVSGGVVSAYSSLGLSPLLTFCSAHTSTRLHNITAAWIQDEEFWSITVNVSDCGVECCVSVQLESLAGNCGAMEWKAHFLRVSEAPLLQWLTQLPPEHLLSSISSSQPSPVLSTHLQCSPRVAVVIAGLELFYTTTWFSDPSNTSFDICSLAGLSPSECASLQLEDLTITHWGLFLLTSAGLYKSDIVSGKLILQDAPSLVLRGYFMEPPSLFCQGAFIADGIVQVVAPAGTSVVVCSSHPPYTEWTTRTTLCSSDCGRVAAAYDSQRRQYITAVTGSDSVVRTSSGQVLGNTTVSVMFYHSTSSAVYLLGSRVWLSVDGGVRFNSLLELSDPVLSYSHDNQAVLILTASGGLYFSRPGGQFFAQLPSISAHPLTQIVLDDSNIFRVVDLNNKTSQLLRRSTQAVGLCFLSYEQLNLQLLYLYDNNSNCSVNALVGYRADEASLGAGLVINAFDQGALVAMMLPVSTTSGEGVWSFKEEQCWSILTIESGFEPSIHELDLWDSVELRVKATNPAVLPRHFLDITVTVGHPELIDLVSTSTYTSTTHTLIAILWQKNSTIFPVYSSVTFHLAHCSSVCETCTATSLLQSGCPSGKQLQFLYPPSQSPEQLYTLSVNYRPPSALGTAIPSSPHVYNVDPASLINSPYSEVDALLKQCSNKSTRAACECSQDQRTSTDISASDCIEKARPHLYEVVFSITFKLLTMVGTREITTAVQLEELNSRSDFMLIRNNGVISSIQFKVAGTLDFSGPGLFHFKATLENSTSFCQLSTQFTVFVEHTPLLKAGELTITTLTTVVFGLLTIVAYLLHYLKQSRKLKHSSLSPH